MLARRDFWTSSKLLEVLLLHVRFSLKGGIHDTLASPSGSTTAMFTCYHWPLVAVVDCGSLTNPMNGNVSLINNTFGSTAIYSCDTGYDLIGRMTSTCGADGNWSSTNTTCQSKWLIQPGKYRFANLYSLFPCNSVVSCNKNSWIFCSANFPGYSVGDLCLEEDPRNIHVASSYKT